jgi:hypothetical protein
MLDALVTSPVCTGVQVVEHYKGQGKLPLSDSPFNKVPDSVMKVLIAIRWGPPPIAR